MCDMWKRAMPSRDSVLFALTHNSQTKVHDIAARAEIKHSKLSNIEQQQNAHIKQACRNVFSVHVFYLLVVCVHTSAMPGVMQLYEGLFVVWTIAVGGLVVYTFICCQCSSFICLLRSTLRSNVNTSGNLSAAL
eukprot:10456-Heterococcus_DN1.PRE.3